MELIKSPPDIKNAKRIGIMGGAFNPIHYGHLAAAEAARCEQGLDFILFIPTGQPPHKESVTHPEHRYLMTILATASNPHFHSSRMEIEREGPSYTVDTIRLLKEQTDAELFFIVGADELLQISNWKNSEELLKLCHWISAVRPGYDASEQISRLNATLLKIPGIDVSGTELRERSKNNQSIKYMLPDGVERYVRELGLYKTGQEENIWQEVAEQMSSRRYIHTIGILEASLLLAEHYDADMHKTFLAALLHDYAKEYSEEKKRSLCNKFKIKLDEVQDGYINMMHGPIGAELAKQKYNVTDSEILAAIRYHTTGRSGMGLIEKIVKLADNIERTREYYPQLEMIRKLSLYDLDGACAAAIKRDIEYTEGKGRTIHPWGLQALEYLAK